MPTGLFIRRRAENNFIKEYPSPWFQKATNWLAHIEVTENRLIQHARNNAEYRIKIGSRLIPVDGYCKQTNTVYQFQGCW